LYFESEIVKTALGKDVIQLYQEGVLTEHSIGFNIVKSERDKEGDNTKLLELKLWEGSTVSWGANSEALVVGIKSGNKEDRVKRLVDYLDRITKAATTGNFTDDTARQLEIQMKQLQELIISLVKEEPAEPLIEEEPITAEEIIKMLNLKKI